jgi:hypothetical protein
MTTETKHMPEQEIEAAFEEYRKNRFGVYAEYPIDAFTHFGAGYKAASQSRASDQSERVRELEAALAEARKVIGAVLPVLADDMRDSGKRTDGKDVAVVQMIRDWLTRNSEQSNESI